MRLPYAHLGLRRNPFGEPPEEDLPELLVAPHVQEVEALLDRPDDLPVTIQFLGECGRGKSASMRAMRATRLEAHWIYLSDLSPHPPIPWREISRPGAILFVDESQRLSWMTRQRLFMTRCTLVLGTHEDHSRELMARWRGRSVHTREVGGLSSVRLRAVLEKRIAWANADPLKPPRIHVSEELLTELLARHGDDLRATLDTTYELVQTMSSPGRIPLPSSQKLPYIPESRHLKRGEIRHVHHHLFSETP